MNVEPSAVQALVGQGLATPIQDDSRLQALVLRLADEMVRYGADVLPREVFRRKSGAELAAMACEDVEGALALENLVLPRRERVEVPAPAPSEVEEGAVPAEPEVRYEEIPPRVVHLSRGFGLPALVLALLHPGQPFEVLEPDRGRQWFYRRLLSLHRVRNLKVVDLRPEVYFERHRAAIDVVLVKGMPPHVALSTASPLLVPGGHLVTWQRDDRSKDFRKHLHDERGLRLRLSRSVAMESAAAAGRALHVIGCGAEAPAEETAVG